MTPGRAAARTFLVGGMLPLVAFVIVEQLYGTKGGVIAGLVFGGGEIAWELWKTGKVHGITILSNALVLVLGVLSLWEENGVFFKLQPAIFMAVFSGVFLISSVMKRPFLLELSKKQNPDLPDFVVERLRGMNVRIGFLFIALAALSAYSAFYWSTAAWAALKAFGLPLLLGLYIVLELVWVRWNVRRRLPPS